MEESNKHFFSNKDALVLLFCVFITGFCTIIYELLIGSISSYFIGDSIKQFSITIGLTMTAMGIGTLLSRFVKENLIYKFIVVEIALAIFGGFAVPILYFIYSLQIFYYPVMCFLIIVIGTLIGLEIPLLTRILEKYFQLRENISNVLSLDYLGAFIASLAFPFILLPIVGIFNTSVLTGLLNMVIAIFAFNRFKNKLTHKKRIIIINQCIFIIFILIAFLVFSKGISMYLEKSMYDDRVVFTKQTKYQKLVITRNKADVRLFIDGNVQFSTIDEYRYHEPLVHIPMSLVKHHENILVLGGGDGLAAREILKYNDVKNITVVDLDKEMTDLAVNNKIFAQLNNNSFKNAKVKVINTDAFKFLEDTDKFYDVIIIDLPDPNNSSLSRLYSREFYKIAGKKLSKNGVLVTQATSPFFSPEAYWCVTETLKSAGFKYVKPYHTYVPSFGDWGFVLAGNLPINISKIDIKVPAKYIENKAIENYFYIEKDLYRKNIKPSTLDKPKILEYYLNGWRYWN